MLTRQLEPEVMDSVEDAHDYDSMDHSTVNRVFVDDFLAFAQSQGFELATTASPVRVLDVGTGTALIPIELCRRPTSCEVLAIDLATEMLKLAECNVVCAGLAEQIQTALMDAKRMPCADSTFDAVISNSIVHHIPEPSGVFAEMVRVLRPGGLLFVRDLLRPDSRADIDRLVATYAGQENAHSRQLFSDSLGAALSLAEVCELAAAHGIPTSSVVQTSDRHWTVGWVKR